MLFIGCLALPFSSYKTLSKALHLAESWWAVVIKKSSINIREEYKPWRSLPENWGLRCTGQPRRSCESRDKRHRSHSRGSKWHFSRSSLSHWHVLPERGNLLLLCVPSIVKGKEHALGSESWFKFCLFCLLTVEPLANVLTFYLWNSAHWGDTRKGNTHVPSSCLGLRKCCFPHHPQVVSWWLVNEFISKFLWSVGASEMRSPDTVAQGFPCGGGGHLLDFSSCAPQGRTVHPKEGCLCLLCAKVVNRLSVSLLRRKMTVTQWKECVFLKHVSD